MTTNTTLAQEYLDLKEKLDKIDSERKPLQKRFTYVRNRMATIKVRKEKKESEVNIGLHDKKVI